MSMIIEYEAVSLPNPATLHHKLHHISDQQLHYYAYALQFDTGAPSACSMQRSDHKNVEKSTKTTSGVRGQRSVTRRAYFKVPNKYGYKMTKERVVPRIIRGRGRARGMARKLSKHSNTKPYMRFDTTPVLELVKGD